MKRIIHIVFAISSLYLVSCESDNQDEPKAPVKVIDERDKYIGYWLCTEVSKSNPTTTYTISIGKPPSSTTEVIINNFYNKPTQARLFVTANSVSIPNQNLTTLGAVNGTGTLTINGTQLKMNYIVKIGTMNDDTCTASCIKK